MNIVQIREKVKFWTDHVNSPRHSISNYMNAINSAIISIVDDRYHNLRENRPYSFESFQRIRDELYTIVARSSAITASGDTLTIATFPTDYKYLLNLTVTISGDSYPCEPTTYDEIDLLERNPYKRPQISYPSRVFYIEYDGGIRVYFGDVGTLATGVMDYLKEPDIVDEGTTHVVATGNFAATQTVIALETTVYSGTTYTIGQQFTVTIGTNITSGSVAVGYTDTDLPVALHDEISKLAASMLEGTVDDYNKMKMLENESNKS